MAWEHNHIHCYDYDQTLAMLKRGNERDNASCDRNARTAQVRTKTLI